MTDLTRRNFLRGIVAAAGVAAVGMPMLPAIASEAPPPELPFPDHEDGDLFIRVNGVWRFAGKVKTFEIVQHDGWINPGEFRMISYFDKEGYGLLAAAYYEGMVHEVVFSHHGMLFMMKAFFAAMSITTSRDELIQIEIDARLSGDPVMTTQSLPASVRNRNETSPRFHKKSNKFSDSQSMG